MMPSLTFQNRANRLIMGMAMSMLSVALTACGSNRVDDNLTPTALAKTNMGVAVLKVVMMDTGCGGIRVTLGQDKGTHFETAHILNIHVGLTSKTTLMIQDLPQGTYHVTSAICREYVSRGRQTNILGQTDGTFGFGQYKKSFAYFTIGAGEVVNFGVLQIIKTGDSTVRLAVTDLQSDERAELREKNPKLSASMKTRLMVVTSQSGMPAPMQPPTKPPATKTPS
jgi:hypothetical protein